MEIHIPRVEENAAGGDVSVLPLEVIDTSEALDELEPLSELQPLPPEPMEEGLELLPSADERGRDRNASDEGAAGMDSDERRGRAREEPEELRELEELEELEGAASERPSAP